MFKFLKINERRLLTAHNKLDNEDTYSNTLILGINYKLISYNKIYTSKCTQI